MPSPYFDSQRVNAPLRQTGYTNIKMTFMARGHNSPIGKMVLQMIKGRIYFPIRKSVLQKLKVFWQKEF